ncbi:MAG: hypothetical protein JW973_14960 [Bacteroidales bacterium]|nr:hypothetical protein [Bacteroidales bacterium]
MSLFIDVIEGLSRKVKTGLKEIIERERKNQDRPVRKICDICNRYLDYGELRYDKMEDGIARLKQTGLRGSDLNLLLMAVLNESLDEDQTALEHFTEFSGSSLADNIRSELMDFIAIGKFVTIHDYHMLENAGSVMVERYTDEESITDTLSNLYLKAENEEYIPVFQRLIARAKELHPSSISLEALNGFINTKGKEYRKALESFLIIKDRLEEDKDTQYYDYQLASVWDSIAGCYLKLGDAAKTMESCDIALEYDRKAGEYKVGNAIFHKKAEAFLLIGEKEQALAIVNHILDENKDDKEALEIKSKIAAG